MPIPQRHRQSFDISDPMFPSFSNSPTRTPLLRESKSPANPPPELAEEEVYFGDTETTKPQKKRVRKARGRSTASPENETPFINPNAVVFMANIPGEVIGLEDDEPVEADNPPTMPYGMPTAQQLGIMRVLAASNSSQNQDHSNGAGTDSTMPNSSQGSNASYSSSGNVQASPSLLHSGGAGPGPSSMSASYTSGAAAAISQPAAPPRYTPAEDAQSTYDAPPPYTRGRRLTRD
ncbi:uncharacterized protein LAJ45_01150 [Morchella importuna]|uniref:uncharacterized protein n=1 Tax=Morchella importuna TaxID=1174673 RepID=UPI001E8E9B2A|nr:uncharacterized protein LAJ45_01150 [Morchella importuna]KAH8154622.1 hypothetical protein LAJ45_01150 [Morchella importuna]